MLAGGDSLCEAAAAEPVVDAVDGEGEHVSGWFMYSFWPVGECRRRRRGIDGNKTRDGGVFNYSQAAVVMASRSTMATGEREREGEWVKTGIERIRGAATPASNSLSSAGPTIFACMFGTEFYFECMGVREETSRGGWGVSIG